MKKTIGEKNRMFAEFMEVEKHIDMTGANRWRHSSNLSVWVFDIGLEYCQSWEWLMPVIEKIESLNFTSESAYLPLNTHRFWFFSAGAKVVEGRGDTKFKAHLDAAVKFIEWYNKQQNKQP